MQVNGFSQYCVLAYFPVSCLIFLTFWISFCRPLSEDETKLHTPVVVSCNDNRREICAVQTIANKQIDRTFVFDKVCVVFG